MCGLKFRADLGDPKAIGNLSNGLSFIYAAGPRVCHGILQMCADLFQHVVLGFCI
jgi:hypothetical protein